MALIDPSVTPFVATFLLVFSIMYFLLQKSKITGEDNKNLNAVMAAAIAAFAASFQPLVAALQGFLPAAVIVLVIAFVLFFLKNTGKILMEGEDRQTVAAGLAVSLLLVGILWNDIVQFVSSLFPGGSPLGPSLPAFISPGNALWLVGIVIIILIFYIANKQPPA